MKSEHALLLGFGLLALGAGGLYYANKKFDETVEGIKSWPGQAMPNITMPNITIPDLSQLLNPVDKTSDAWQAVNAGYQAHQNAAQIYPAVPIGTPLVVNVPNPPAEVILQNIPEMLKTPSSGILNPTFGQLQFTGVQPISRVGQALNALDTINAQIRAAQTVSPSPVPSVNLYNNQPATQIVETYRSGKRLESYWEGGQEYFRMVS